MVETLVLAASLLQTPGPPPQSPLTGTWKIEIIDNIPVMPEAPVTLTFSNRVAGNASCNSFQGNYALTGTTLTIESLLTTMKACDGPRMDQERDFLTLLRKVTRFELGKEDRLTLTTTDGKTVVASRK